MDASNTSISTFLHRTIMSDAIPPSTPPRRGHRGRGRGHRGGRGGLGRPSPGRVPQTLSNLQSPDESNVTNDTATTIQPSINGKNAVQRQTDGENDGEVCFICASPVIHIAVAPCNHRTCHICSLRMRALYKNKACAHCRVSCYRELFLYHLLANLVSDELGFCNVYRRRTKL